MDSKNRGNLLVGYFSLDGSFAPIVGIGLNYWAAKKFGQ
jgi:outer membrane protein W